MNTHRTTTGGVRCHNTDACAAGQSACPTPKACGIAPEHDHNADAARWQWARKNLLSAVFQSGLHNSGRVSVAPMNEANTDWYWDRIADQYRTPQEKRHER